MPGAGSGADAGITLPASFAIVPAQAGPRDSLVTLLVEGDTGNERLRRTIRFRLVAQQRSTIPVFLTARCIAPDTRCQMASPCTRQDYCEEQGETCGSDGECVSLLQTLDRDASLPNGSCVPYCTNVACGASDGCGGTCLTGDCGGNGVCQNGVCVCGTGDAVCGATCLPAASIACQPGMMESQPCGACGTQTRTCGTDCQWGSWDVCTGEGACMPGSTRVQDCGACGTQSAACGVDCQWGAWGTCGGTGCTPGDTQTQSCGNCGTQTRSCISSCQWSAWSTCNGQGVCTPGAVDRAGCGDCGTHSRTCTSACAWGSFGTCTGQGCSPGSTRQGSCDPCAHQTCTSSCTWGACGLDSGAACTYLSGTHHRSCSRCACGLQFCLSSCQWSTGCVSFCGGRNSGACQSSCSGGC
jgi:hypothetical protein